MGKGRALIPKEAAEIISMSWLRPGSVKILSGKNGLWALLFFLFNKLIHQVDALFSSLKPLSFLDKLNLEFGYLFCLYFIYSIAIKVLINQKEGSHNIEDEEQGGTKDKVGGYFKYPRLIKTLKNHDRETPSAFRAPP